MKKRVIIIFIILLGIILVGVGVYTYINFKEQKRERNLISKIENSYAPVVSINKTKKIYLYEDKKYKEVGTLAKDTIISLEKKKIVNSSDIFYKIKDTDYYIDYKNLGKVKDYKEDISLDNYVVTNTIKTNPTNLYRDDKLMISIDKELEFDVLLKENNKYYIKFLGNYYYIKDFYELNEVANVDVLKSISVLNFSDDILDEKFSSVLSVLNEKKYETISITDFERWIKGEVNLENNKVLLLSYKELNDAKKKIVGDYGYIVNTNLEGITFTSGDTKLKIGDTKYYKYDINTNTTIDRVKDMLNGVKVKVVAPSSSGVAVLNYHFFYDSSIGEGCNESICLDVKNFRQQLQYLKDNNYKVLTMKEFNDWMDKKITFNQKAVLITVDDGAMGTSNINGNKLIPLLEEFQMPATLFLITGWWDKVNYQSQYLEVHSHGDELHHNSFCREGKCTYKGLLLSKEELKTDLQLSIDKTGNNLAFCYPFYQKNNTMIEALKETGFKLAFVGGNRKAKQSDNKYAIPRYVVYKSTSLNNFINMVK